MAKVRKDTKGRVLHKGELYRKDKELYCYAYMDSFGNRRYLYAHDLGELRDKENLTTLNKLEKIDVYARAKSNVNYVFDRYMSTKSELRSTTRTNYEYTYNRYVRDGFGKQKIGDICYSDVLIFYKALLDRGLSVNTIDGIHTVLHPTFQMAVRDNIIRNNPTDGAMAELKRKADIKAAVRSALTWEQEQAFLNWIKRPEYCRWDPFFTVMFGTGGRVGEVIGLRWPDLDFEQNNISINHSVTYYPRSEKSYKCEFRVSLPKTKMGIRDIPMLEKVKDALNAEREFQRETGHRCIMELDGMSDFVFCNRFGNLHNPSCINREIKRIVDDYNAHEEVRASKEGRQPLLLPRFSNHVTRHTFCTRLCENETNIKVIQTVMGHKDIQTTLDIYAEVSEQKKQEVFRQLNSNNVL